PRPGARSFAAAAGAAAVVVAGLTGWLVGGASDPAPRPSEPAALTTLGPATFAVPPSWTPARKRRPVGVRSFATAPGLPARALISFAPATGRSLVPPGLLAGLEGDLGRPRRDRLAGLAAWTYGPIQSKRTLIQMTIVPTAAGVLGVACTAPMETWNVASGCGADVRALSFDGTRPLKPAADVAFRLRLRPVMGKLDTRRVRGRAALRRKASRPAAARRLARAHARAASTLAPLAPSGAPARLVGALRRDARAYRRFGHATRGRPSRAGARSRARVVAAERALRRAMARLRGH
ncbi:MAG: hypothetical protein ACRDPC_27050, partial [Solirubrobacteraceae bacterium]